uniref:Uncharacterized protein n=1 Tax=Anguilla anguilla TaxID=7936 RepID=A0A0E9VYX6_ANGAN
MPIFWTFPYFLHATDTALMRRVSVQRGCWCCVGHLH